MIGQSTTRVTASRAEADADGQDPVPQDHVEAADVRREHRSIIASQRANARLTADGPRVVAVAAVAVAESVPVPVARASCRAVAVASPWPWPWPLEPEGASTAGTRVRDRM